MVCHSDEVRGTRLGIDFFQTAPTVDRIELGTKSLSTEGTAAVSL